MNITQINDKTEALDYLYYVHNKETEYNPELFALAKTFFDEDEFVRLNLEPDIIANDCFCGLANKCGLTH